jgi:dCMP deaminase
MRPDKAEKYFELAKHTARLFSKDTATKVGAIFLAPESHQILTMGYNGMPRGFNETNTDRWERPQKYLYVEHAERNAIYNACRNGVPLENSIAIVSMFPCADCMRGLIQSGVKTILAPEPDLNDDRWGSHFQASLEMAKECGIELQYMTAMNKK